MNAHTKEPWVLDKYGHPKVEMNNVVVSGFTLSASELAETNTHRILACVNACAGIPTERLEILDASDAKASVDSMLQWLDQRNAVTKQRNELLAALKKLVDRDLTIMSGFAHHGVISNQDVQDARAIIAKIEAQS